MTHFLDEEGLGHFAPEFVCRGFADPSNLWSSADALSDEILLAMGMDSAQICLLRKLISDTIKPHQVLPEAKR